MDDQNLPAGPVVDTVTDCDIAARDLYKTYQSGNETLVVLDRIGISLPAGSRVVVTGESGAGKTTFLNLLSGLDRADGGSLVVGGRELQGMAERDLGKYRRTVVGLVFQFHYLLKEFTALENVMLPAFMNGMPRREATDRARELLCQVGLEERTGHYPSQLSGGERQRAALARALVNDPRIILADEPTGNLDERNAGMVEDLLFNLALQHRKTLVLVTHNARLSGDGDIHLHLTRGGFIDSRTVVS